MEAVTPTSRRSAARTIPVIVVLALALVVRLQMISRAEAVASDSATHLAMARELGVAPTGEVLRAYDYHPGYATMVAAAARAGGAETPEQWISAGRAVSLAMGMVALVCLYAIARSAFGHTIAVLSLLMVSLSPQFSELSCDALSDAPALAFALAGVAVGIYASRRGAAGLWRALPAATAAGLSAGLAYLIRPEGLLAALLTAVLFTSAVRRKGRPRAVAILSLTALLAAVLICLVPYSLAVGGLTQKKAVEDFVGPLAGGGSMLAALTAGPTVPAALWEVLDRGRAAMGNTVFALSVVCWVTWLVRFGFRVRLPEGIVYRPRSDTAIVMALAVGVMIPLLTALEARRGYDGGYVSSRHMLLPAMLLAPAAGAGLLTLTGWAVVLTRRLGGKARPGLAVLLCITAAGVAMAAEMDWTLHKGKAPFRAAGRAVRFALGDGARGLTSQRRVAFYAGSPSVQFRRDTAGRFRIRRRDLASADSVLRRAEHAGGVSYMAVDRSLLESSGHAEIVAELREDPRFYQLGVFGVGEAGEVHVFVLLPNPDKAGAVPPHAAIP
ncbi:MAG: glycosyltransferase family 39 protein [Phycisphaerae bacterium]